MSTFGDSARTLVVGMACVAGACQGSDGSVGEDRSFADPVNCLEVDDVAACCTNARITEDAADEQHLDVVWTGAEHGLAFERDQTIHFLAIDREAHPAIEPLPISSVPTTGLAPTISFGDGDFGVAWQDTRDDTSQIYFARVDAETMSAESEVRVTESEAGTRAPDLEWNGNDYGLVWEEGENQREVFFQRVSADGDTTGEAQMLAENSANSATPQLAWNDSRDEFGVVWADARYDGGDAEVLFARVDASGELVDDSEVRVSNATGDSVDPKNARNGQYYGIAWRDRREFSDGAIYFAALDSAGGFASSEAPELAITAGEGAVFVGNIESDGSVFVIVWNELREDGEFDEIYFAIAHPTSGIRQAATRLSYMTGSEPATGYERVTFNETDFSVFWFDGRNGGNDIYMGRVNATGACL